MTHVEDDSIVEVLISILIIIHVPRYLYQMEFDYSIEFGRIFNKGIFIYIHCIFD